MARRRFLYKKHTSHGDLNCKSFVLSHCLCCFTQKAYQQHLERKRGLNRTIWLIYVSIQWTAMLHAQYWQTKVPAYRGRVPSDNLHIVTIHYSSSLSTKSSFFLPSLTPPSLSSLLCSFSFFTLSCSVVCCLSLLPLSNSCYLVYLWALSLPAVLGIIILSGLSLPSNIHRQRLKL